MSTVDVAAILRLLPHRYPMLLVDRVVRWEAGQSLRALKNVSVNEPCFQGHFPGEPIFPGVLIVEAMAQASILLAYLSGPEDDRPLHLFAGIDRARFKRVVRPGDQLVIDVTLGEAKRGLQRATCVATVDGQVACAAELMSATAPRPRIQPG